MRIPTAAGAMALLLAQSALAGPWPREAGQVFLSFSAETTVDREEPLVLPEYDATLYAEAGLGNRFTLGADLYQGPNSHTYLVFLERTLTPGDARNQFAVRLGGGTGEYGAGATTLGLAGLAWGRGFETRWGNGWAVLDAQLRLRSTGGEEVKVDATLGLAPHEDWLVIGQLQAADFPDSPESLRVQATAVRRLSDRFSLEGGVVYGLANSSRAGLKLGLWTEF